MRIYANQGLWIDVERDGEGFQVAICGLSGETAVESLGMAVADLVVHVLNDIEEAGGDWGGLVIESSPVVTDA